MNSKNFLQNISKSNLRNTSVHLCGPLCSSVSVLFFFLHRLHRVTQRSTESHREIHMKTIHKIDIIHFLELSENIAIADVRSPSEYNSGHIPGAVNIPLFDDKERESVGIKYKKEGRLPAILEGLKHTGPAMTSKLEQGLKIATGGRTPGSLLAWRYEIGSNGLAVFAC